MTQTAACFASLALAACGGGSTDAENPATDVAAPATLNGAAPEKSDRYETKADEAASLDAIGEAFVKLALGIGTHDPAFVDAYHGPAEWADAADAENRSLESLEVDARGLLISVEKANAVDPGIRGAMLEKLIRAGLTRIQMARGETFFFDEETRLLYDVVAPQYDLTKFDAALAEINTLLPGGQPLNERVDAFRNKLAISEDKLQSVFDAAIAECRKRTLAHYTLPENERFRLEFVTDKPWSGYNWYQGDHESLIQVNTDFPIIIDRAVDLGCHEGYPGHHTWNVLLERDILGKAGWIEYSVYPLFSPLSVIAEGSANFGIDLAFPGDEKIKFERDVLFPLADLDPADAPKLEKLNKVRRKLGHVQNHIAREYLDGRITAEEAIAMNMKYRLESRDRAEQSLRFIDTYRGYVLNYNLGRDLVEDYVSARTEEGATPWDAFEQLLTTPLAASDLAASQ